MRGFSIQFSLLLTLLMQGALATNGVNDPSRLSIEFETTEVTRPDLAVSPDGRWLIFTMLGHLFQIPAEGGEARQLTFGPFFDGEPAISPDGSRVVFTSDRHGDDRNVFVLDLITNEIVQLTREPWASRPVWRPDGGAIAYLGIEGARERCPNNLSWVRRLSLNEREPVTLTDSPLSIRSLFYLPDGRLAWTIHEGDPHYSEGRTRIEVSNGERGSILLRTLDGMWNHLIPSVREDGFYGTRRRHLPHHGFFGQPTDLMFVPDSQEPSRHLATMGSPYCFPEDPEPAISGTGDALYVGEGGDLLKIALPAEPPERLAFRARLQMQVHPPVEPRARSVAAPSGSLEPRSLLDPQLSPDGRTLVFVALGYIWEQSLDGGNAMRVTKGDAFERHPRFSPDGHRLAYVHSRHGLKEIRVLNRLSGEVRTLQSAPSFGYLNWHPDGKQLLAGGKRGGRFRLLALDVEKGGEEVVGSASPRYWYPRPHFSADGGSIYYTDDSSGTAGLYRFSPEQERADAEAVTPILDQFQEGLVSPDGKLVAYRRNADIWVAPLPLDAHPPDDLRRISTEGGASFSFTPDGSGLIYAAGNRVWRQSLGGGAREEIPITLALVADEPEPLLVRRVRLLDFSTGGFGPETSLLIRGGRLEWIGSEDGQPIPDGVSIIDVNGGFAIPGLFDMHVHVESSWTASDVAQEAFIAFGVTSVRDMGEPIGWVEALADRSRTAQPVPRYFYPGNAFESSQPRRGGWGLGILGEDEVRAYVERLNERGVYFIKSHPPISWPLREAVVEEARRLGLPVAGHGSIIEELARGVTSGIAFIEHAGGPGGRVYDDVLQLMAAAGTRWDPTLMNMGVGLVWAREEPERWDDPKIRAFVPEEDLRILKIAWGAVDNRALRGFWFEQLSQIRDADRRGVKLHIGTDAQFWQMVHPGSSLHMEMELFAQAGLAPLEVLRLATIEAATALGVQGDLGTLEVGKLADIVLLEENPLDDIVNSQAIRWVIKDGRVFDPREIQAHIGSDG